MIRTSRAAFALLAAAFAVSAGVDPARSDDATPPRPPTPPIQIQRAAGVITLDGDLSDPGWRGLEPITTWFETNVGDNVEPQVKNKAYLTYDDRFFYAGFEFEDPTPRGVRAPIGDHDAVPSSTDYAGVIVDSHNDGKTAQMFLANPHGVQYDAITSDASGEDSSPDFYWDSVGKVTATGWNLEIRIPFSSLRYAQTAQPVWGILLYRNYPRDRRYQFFSARLPRDVNCFICNSSKLHGLASLPHGSHFVVAPYATAQQEAVPKAGLGTPLEAQSVDTQAGVDLKWSPSSSLAIDATLNPDFSQIESDVAQIVANERFAVFFPEKRPFFLEGVDLLSFPMQAVYTRTITSPSGGLRATGKIGTTAYTALGVADDGGGGVIIPGPQGSHFAHQDFKSDVGIARLRTDFGRSYLSVLGSGRVIDGGGHNFVVGPDFQWRPRAVDSFTGQYLVSDTQTPNRPELESTWDGRQLTDYAAQVSWSHGDTHWDWYLQGQDLGPDFRDDNGFIFQVGYREAYGEAGYTTRPKDAFLNRIRFWTANYYDVETDGRPLFQHLATGVGMDGAWNSFMRVELNLDDSRVGDEWLQRFRPRVLLQASPWRALNQISIDTYFGDEIDFDNAREGTGLTCVASCTIRPSDHLELRPNASVRYLDVPASGGGTGRLFTTQVERLRATYSFSSRSFVRLIGQYVQTTSDTALYTFEVAPKEAVFSGSGLFAYKLNWQTVFYVGYGDQREFEAVTEKLQTAGQQVFAKVSYSLQR